MTGRGGPGDRRGGPPVDRGWPPMPGPVPPVDTDALERAAATLEARCPGRVGRQVSLAPLTTFRLGGPGAVFLGMPTAPPGEALAAMAAAGQTVEGVPAARLARDLAAQLAPGCGPLPLLAVVNRILDGAPDPAALLAGAVLPSSGPPRPG